uniref:Uncharacterized protein n=1 Tax=Panagrellus redivivus TaxID=6233 RepID=A0A7E4W088_PANRE
MATPLEALISFCENAFNQNGEYQGFSKVNHAQRTSNRQLSPIRYLHGCFDDPYCIVCGDKLNSDSSYGLRRNQTVNDRFRNGIKSEYPISDQRRWNEEMSRMLSPFRKMEQLKLSSSSCLKSSMRIHNIMKNRRKFSLLSSPNHTKQMPRGFRMNSSMRRWQEDVIPIISTKSNIVQWQQM